MKMCINEKIRYLKNDFTKKNTLYYFHPLYIKFKQKY